jgi:sulfur-oxidizing protein SoxY
MQRSTSPQRRKILTSAAALAALHALPGRAAPLGLPDIPELVVMLGGRTPRTDRLVLDLPRIADDGSAVPTRLLLPGPFAPGTHLRTLALFSERNPVRTMMMVEFPAPVARIEFETRIRLNGSQRIVAVAMLADDTVHTAVADIIVAASACVDGT